MLDSLARAQQDETSKAGETMSTVVTMTRKGQLTIPKDLRDELGLKPLDRIEIVPDGKGGAHLRKAPTSISELMGSLPANGLSVEEAMERAEKIRGYELAADYVADCR
jgi:antitoxin PrlF